MKEVTLEQLVNLLIGENSYIVQFNSIKNRFPYASINKSKENRLNKEYQSFTDLLVNIQSIYQELFKITVNKNTPINDLRKAENYLKLCSQYLNIIQNIYLNPINYRLNQLNNKKSLRFAWIVAIVSLVLSSVSIVLTCYYGEKSIPNTCPLSKKSSITNIEKICIEQTNDSILSTSNSRKND